MPGFLAHLGAQVICLHGGPAVPNGVNARLLVSGQPTVTLPLPPYTVTGCGLAATGSPPCVSGQWFAGSTRVLSNGQPLVIQNGQATCVPTGTGLLVLIVQTRVFAQ